MITTIIVFFVILGVLVFVHEFGHYITAKLFKVDAQEFGFGLPPRICGWRKVNGKRKFFWGNKEVDEIESEDTIWSLNWLPIGGFVKIKGEDGENQESDSFATQKPWKRAIILSAGVTMNFVLAAVLLMFVFGLGAPQAIDGLEEGAVVSEPKIQIMQVVPESVAEENELAVGDVIVAINNQEIETVEQVQDLISQNQDQEILLTVNHFGETIEKNITPRYDEDLGRAALGVALIETGIVKYPWYLSIWLGIKSTVLMTGAILVAFYEIIRNLLVGLPAGVEVAGPVGIAVMTGQVARLGIVYVLQFAAVLSINLAIINILPFPALDGGRLLFIALEKIRRKPVDQKVERIIHATGLIILLGLILLVTGRDILNIIIK